MFRLTVLPESGGGPESFAAFRADEPRPIRLIIVEHCRRFDIYWRRRRRLRHYLRPQKMIRPAAVPNTNEPTKTQPGQKLTASRS
jgi:hypothetical protein